MGEMSCKNCSGGEVSHDMHVRYYSDVPKSW